MGGGLIRCSNLKSTENIYKFLISIFVHIWKVGLLKFQILEPALILKDFIWKLVPMLPAQYKAYKGAYFNVIGQVTQNKWIA